MSRRYLKLYEFTVVAGIRDSDEASATAARIHDVLVAAGFDISNAVFGQRTTRKAIETKLKEAGVDG